jgi:hypothetical protein
VRRAGWGAVLGLALLLLATACGTTVDPGRLEAYRSDPDAGLGLQEPTTDATTGGPDDPSVADPGDEGGDDGGPGGSGIPSPSVGPPGAPAPGVTDDTITLGFVTSENADAANQALGSSEITAGDGRAIAEATIDEVNGRGGIAGRKIEPVFATIDATSNEPFSAQFERICERFTRDHKVYAVVGAGQVTENFLACIERAGVANVNGGFSNNDARIFAKYPRYIEVGMMNLTRIAASTVNGLWRQGFFAQGERIGLVTYDSPQFENAVNDGLIPALAGHGLALDRVSRLRYPERLSDVGTASSQASSAALRFKSRTISRVLILDYNALATALFMQAADNAEYSPKYGLNSQNGGSQLSTLLPSCCAQQLPGAQMVGWSPLIDLNAEDWGGYPKTASRKRCMQTMDAHGVTFDSANANGNAIIACDTLWFLEAAVEAGSAAGEIDAATFLTGVHALGTSFQAGDTFQNRYDAEHHDGVSQIADASFVEACSCFRYTSRPYSVP